MHKLASCGKWCTTNDMALCSQNAYPGVIKANASEQTARFLTSLMILTEIEGVLQFLIQINPHLRLSKNKNYNLA